MVLTKLVQVGSAIRCQKCSGDFGLCNGLSDNGETVNCPEDHDLCYYHEFRKHYYSNSYFVKPPKIIFLDYIGSDVRTIHRDCAISYFNITHECSHTTQDTGTGFVSVFLTILI